MSINQRAWRASDCRVHATEIVNAVLEAADPALALTRAWPADLDDGRPTVLFAIGKASLEMANVAVQRLGTALVRAVITAVPERMGQRRWGGRMEVWPADHPAPTERNVEAARAVAEAARQVTSDQRVLMLISGGGSAHLTLPAEGITLDDLRAVTKALQNGGAPIQDLNTVRKHCEQLKGGRLAAMLASRDIRTFILSDVMGDRPDVIASGPLTPDPTTYADALTVLARYGATPVAPRLTKHLRLGATGQIAETPQRGDSQFPVLNTLIASNSAAVDAAAERLAGLGFRVAEFRKGVEGEAASIGRELAADLRACAASSTKPACMIIGGEPTVTVRREGDVSHLADGMGGPSQELALAAAVELDGEPRIALLAFSTDGIDGPTDAAGAVVTGHTAAHGRAAGLDAAEFLARHDSHTLLDRVGALIRTGPTGTNVNHIAVGLVYPVS